MLEALLSTLHRSLSLHSRYRNKEWYNLNKFSDLFVTQSDGEYDSIQFKAFIVDLEGSEMTFLA